ncbi:tRNA (adenine(58)-N(1))-methyltransferase catalytic subunit TRM61 [Astathelohania contejeani]|uniref:tRNA (adenine(58)-N(1))-methyltransferase catalytic subunit TRM61 n=1 Tax=Astathelohania contejeani TaxID=164912 RepID=A0ABQ7HXT8_9MICR|nr:tRNA (adenine(58)-N(1))-methyltransferase catalytic subunit TRM61 [Thelohania contejeani]
MKISDGDTIILYFNRTHFKKIKVRNGERINTHFGEINHDVVIGKEYNTSIQLKRGICYLFRMDYFFYSRTVNRRTQILYEQDISLILCLLNIRNGSRIIECGTGSGVLTYYLSKHVGCNGRVYTYECDTTRYDMIKSDISEIKMANVEAYHANILETPFLQKEVDAIFLDMPTPWDVLSMAFESLRNGGCICIFVPSFEQVIKVSEALKKYFINLRMFENIKFDYEPMTVDLLNEKVSGFIVKGNQYCHTGYLIFANKQ